MKAKRIWIWACVFAVLATLSFYLFVLKSPEGQVEAGKPTSTTSSTSAPTVQADDGMNHMLPIAAGKRAITLKLDEEKGVAGFIKKGDHVDVIAKIDSPNATQGNAAVLIFQDMKVLAIGNGADDPEQARRYSMVTLEVTPQQGIALRLATQYDLYLMLRNSTDQQLFPNNTNIHEEDLTKGVFTK